jgi:hypothetical protein
MIGRVGAAAVLALVAGAAAAQVSPSRPTSLDAQRFYMLEGARIDQQRLGDQIQMQGLAAGQQRLRTRQTLQSLEAARPPAPFVPENPPTTSSVRRQGAGADRPADTAPLEPSRLPELPPSDAATRGDLPL